MPRQTLRRLSCDSVDAQSRAFDWSVAPYDFEGDSEAPCAWQSWEAVTCEDCGAVVVMEGTGGGATHSTLADQIDDDDEREKARDCEGYMPSAEGPMMSFYWPCDFRPLSCEDAARRIADLPLCVVKVDGDTGFALTGGGMDLSWEIAAAFVACDMLPPCTLRLPAMAGRPVRKAREIIAAMRKSCRVKGQWMRQALRDLRALSSWNAEQTRKARESEAQRRATARSAK